MHRKLDSNFTNWYYQSVFVISWFCWYLFVSFFYIISIFLEQFMYFRVYDKITIGSIFMAFIVIFMIILCNIKVFKRSNFCHNRIFVNTEGQGYNYSRY